MIFNKQYEQKKLIGKGGFGNVYKVLDHKNKNFYALKFITIVENEETENLKEEYEKEIEVMKTIKNKYIVELIDNFYDKEYKGYCIVMELCDGNLRDIMNKYKPNGLSLKLINKILYQLNEALKTMIDNGYIHRDLKPENILIKYTDTNEDSFDIKLTDFGFSSYEIESSIKTHSNVGTEKYKAPEVDNFKYNKKCDLWSLGIILYELYTNKYIFDSKNLKERKINREKGRIVKETDNEMINKLIRKLIQVDIEKRIGWEEYFNDAFFKIKEEEKDEKEEEKEKDKKEEENLKDEKEEEKEKDEKEEEKEKDVKEDEKEKDEKEEDKEKDVKEDEKEKDEKEDEKEKDVKEDEKEKDEKEESKLNSNLLVK